MVDLGRVGGGNAGVELGGMIGLWVVDPPGKAVRAAGLMRQVTHFTVNTPSSRLTEENTCSARARHPR